jgi:transcriptional regulator with GAF, ATPase, and Fis domain
MNRAQGAHQRRPSTLASQQRVINRAAREALPRLADFCLVHIATPRTLRCVAACHCATHFSRDMRTLVSARPIRRDDLVSTVAAVVRSRKPALRTPIYYDDDAVARSTVARLHRKLAPTSALVVPLVSDGMVLGALSLCYSQSGRAHARHQVPIAERLAARVAAVLVAAGHAASRLHAAARHARQKRPFRRRLAARN